MFSKRLQNPENPAVILWCLQNDNHMQRATIFWAFRLVILWVSKRGLQCRRKRECEWASLSLTWRRYASIQPRNGSDKFANEANSRALVRDRFYRTLQADCLLIDRMSESRFGHVWSMFSLAFKTLIVFPFASFQEPRALGWKQRATRLVWTGHHPGRENR